MSIIQPVYVIAEAGVNHNGQRALAFELIDAAVYAGANAVKFQTFDAQRLASDTVPKATYQMVTTGHAESQREMLSRLELPKAWHFELQAYAQSKGIDFLSTAFDEESLSFLATLDLPVYKIPSGEINNVALLWRFAKLNKPLILSTGMATLSEVERALAVITHALNSTDEPRKLHEVWSSWSDTSSRQKLMNRVTLLHCTSQYPSPWEEVNLRAMDTLHKAFGLPVGYSDHTAGIAISVAAVALGALVIEKHLTTDNTLPGPDHLASLMPDDFKQLITDIRCLERALGSGVKVPQKSEWNTRKVVRQSVVAAKSLVSGQVMTREDLTTARINGSVDASQLWDLVGTIAHKSYLPGAHVEWP